MNKQNQLKEQDKILHASINRKDWTIDEWKASDNIIDRTVWFISTLSPHNLWKGYEAIAKIEAETRKQTADEIAELLDSCVNTLDIDGNSINVITPLVIGEIKAKYNL